MAPYRSPALLHPCHSHKPITAVQAWPLVRTVSGNCTMKPTAVAVSAGNLVAADNTNGMAGSTQPVTLSGTGVLAAIPTFSASLLPTPPATVSMSWTASSSVAARPDSYQVQRAGTTFTNAAAACPAAYGNLGAATTALTAADATVVANRTYCYRVVATNAAGSFTAAGVKVTTPAAPNAPTDLTITGVPNRSDSWLDSQWRHSSANRL